MNTASRTTMATIRIERVNDAVIKVYRGDEYLGGVARAIPGLRGVLVNCAPAYHDQEPDNPTKFATIDDAVAFLSSLTPVGEG
jgi:hypothetical protein